MQELKIVYGMFDLGDEREMARASFGYIQRDLADIKNSYIRLGFHLDECKRLKYYNDFGYVDFNEFVEKNFGLDKSALSRCLNVFYRFAVQDNRCRKMFLDNRYSEYSYSQLCEMVSMSDNDCRKVKPDMTIKEIRDLKKQGRKNKEPDASEVATSQPEGTFCKNKLYEYKGAVLQNYIKKCSSDDCKHLWLFDENGKEIHHAVTCDILSVDDNCIYLRVVNLEKNGVF